MGYYDPAPPGNGKTNRGGAFLSGIAGVAVGGLLMWLLFSSVPGLSPEQETATTTTSTENSENLSAEQTPIEITTDVTEAVDIAADAVVGVTNLQTVNDWRTQSQESQAAGTGSGVIYKNENGVAYVVTNQHVIEGASEIEVTLSDGTKITAELVGSDIWTDLAVLQMEGEAVQTVAEFGDSDALKQGETVIAIGNPLGLEFSGSVTTGVVSGTERAVPVDINGDQTVDWQAEVLQTDAAINPGNSGGALINLAGQLVGINSMKIAQSSVEGIGFSIPINTAIPVISSLEESGEVNRPAMGVTLIDLLQVPRSHREQTLNLPEEVNSGVVVESVVPGSAAAAAGMQQYDVIVGMDGEEINNMLELRKHLYNEKQIGDTLNVSAYRGSELIEFELTLTDNTQL